VEERRNIKDELEHSLKLLSPIQQQILSLRFGLQGEAEQSLAEVQEIMQMDRAEVRRVEAAALKIVRAHRKT
jgi:RNA polymerase nonessential primary-like sigma factor